MTPRQIERAVNAALARVLPPHVRALRDELMAELRQHFAARDGAGEAPAEPALSLATPAPAQPTWTFGDGPGRRLTEAGVAEMRRLAEQRLGTGEIARALGVTTRAVNRHLGTRGHIGPSRAERDAAAAEKRRAYQRERIRKLRAEKKPAEAVPPAPETTVVVVPAAVVPAPRQPAVNQAMKALQAKIAEKRPPAPTPEKPKTEPQVITTTTKDVRAWLVAALKAGGLTQLQAMDRVGFMTHDQALEEANQRRLRAGYPPFAFLGTRSAA